MKKSKFVSVKSAGTNGAEDKGIPKNILFKGVPGTGKSFTVDRIIAQIGITESIGELKQVLRINIHSGSSNGDFMQGIGVSTGEGGRIEYKEKRGLILDFLFLAITNPQLPFVLVLEEIQENSLNQLIGDLIYLIEDSKRADLADIELDPEAHYDLFDVTSEIMKIKIGVHTVSLPNLVEYRENPACLLFPANMYVFCTSNYRDDKKVIEDNLLRRFDVIEIYPNYEAIKDEAIKVFLSRLNDAVVVSMSSLETHPDRFMIGQANWINVRADDEKLLARAFLKIIVEFKEIKELAFDQFREIFRELQDDFSEEIKSLVKLVAEAKSYRALVAKVQERCSYPFLLG